MQCQISEAALLRFNRGRPLISIGEVQASKHIFKKLQASLLEINSQFGRWTIQDWNSNVQGSLKAILP